MDWTLRGIAGLLAVVGLVACAPGDGADPGEESTDSGATGTTSTDGTETGTDSDTGNATSTPTTMGDEGSRCDDAYDTFAEGGEVGTSGGDGGETFGGMGGDIPIGATVFEIRQDELDNGTYVVVDGLVITTPVGSIVEGGVVFAQAPEGGEHSALVVVSRYDTISAAPGDIVSIVGRVLYDGAYPRLVVDSDGEITVTGDAALPPAHTVMIGDLADPDALSAYEAALLRVETPQVSDADVCPGEFSLTAELRVDDLFLGEAAPTPTTGAEFSAILGALRYTSDGFEIAPRTVDDLIP